MSERPYPYVKFPKMIYKADSEPLVVQSEEELEEKHAQGWSDNPNAPAIEESVQSEEPTIDENKKSGIFGGKRGKK